MFINSIRNNSVSCDGVPIVLTSLINTSIYIFFQVVDHSSHVEGEGIIFAFEVWVVIKFFFFFSLDRLSTDSTQRDTRCAIEETINKELGRRCRVTSVHI